MEKLLKKLKLFNIILILIIILGFGLRFYQLGKIPSSLNRDEPAIGYNAYSILKTGKDEWGERLPLSFRSFGDYKSPLYIYLTAVSIFLFGLNEFSVRFWAALAGFLLIIFTYLFSKGILNKEDKIYLLTTSFILTISPWAIFYSRFSFEANLALFLNIAILWVLVKVNFKKINLLALFLLLLTFFTYSSSLIIWPIFIIVWSFLILKKFTQKTNKGLKFRLIFKLLTLLLILAIVFYKQIAIGGQKSRVTVFADPHLRLTFNQKRTEIAQNSPWKAKIFYNQYFYYGRIIITNYLNSFSFNFLFGSGGAHPWHKTLYVSHFFPIYSFLFILGLIFFIKTPKINKEKKLFLTLFLFLSAIPSAVTVDAPHATRLLNLFFMLTFFAGLGFGWLFKKIRFLGLIILAILVFNLFQFTRFYFINFKQNPPSETLPGLRETILYLDKNQLGEERVVFGNHADGAYAYLLFYTTYPPLDFINNVKRYSPDTAGLEWVEKFDKFLFVKNPKPNYSQKEVYILKGDNSLGQRLVTKIQNQFNDKIYYTISANF